MEYLVITHTPNLLNTIQLTKIMETLITTIWHLIVRTKIPFLSSDFLVNLVFKVNQAFKIIFQLLLLKIGV
jgi:hypothetical protein